MFCVTSQRKPKPLKRENDKLEKAALYRAAFFVPKNFSIPRSMKLIKTKILISVVLLIVGICTWQFSSLYSATQPAFEKLEKSIPKNRRIYASEAYIGTLLFEDRESNQMGPAEFIVRTALQNKSERGIFRHHVLRIILAKRLSHKFSDETLLIHWLSTFYFGNDEYGLAAVADGLFDKDIQTLTDSEALTIAALVKAPSQFRNYPKLWENRKTELSKRQSK